MFCGVFLNGGLPPCLKNILETNQFEDKDSKVFPSEVEAG